MVDEEATDRLRAEAAAAARRAYDFDTRLAPATAKRIDAAFAAVSERRATFRDAHPELNQPERLSRAALARLDEALGAALEEVRPEFERLLGTPLEAAELAVLRDAGFEPEIGRAMSALAGELLAAPVIAEREALRDDAATGITVQRVPDDGAPDLVINDVTQIPDRDALVDRLPGLLEDRLPLLTTEQRATLAGLLARLLDGNLTVNLRATEIARELARVSVNPVNISFKEGETLVRDGDRLSARHLAVFTELNRRTGEKPRLAAALAVALWVLLAVGVVFTRQATTPVTAPLGPRDLTFAAGLFIGMLLLLRAWSSVAGLIHTSSDELSLAALLALAPVAAGSLIARMVMRLDVALAFALVQGLTIGLFADLPPWFLGYAVVGAVLGALTLRTLARRSDLLRAGGLIGLGQAVMAVVVLLGGEHSTLPASLAVIGAALVSGPIAAVIALAFTAVIEALFGYTTDLKLLELANLNHPALKELIVQAPGSYHHSIIVGSLVEAAAEEIGAKALLARVMAYYHDIGKVQNPGYFSENQRGGANPHNKLKPNMSARILRRHVSDGLELARRHHLGDQIQAGIAEHHGTTLISFFFQKAKEAEEEGQPVTEVDFRYTGPKPQSREAALVMLGDAVEAAARSLAEPSPARLQGLVHRVINLKFTDGQLDECDLTLRDLHLIARAFARVLASIYHERPEYPGTLGELSGKKSDGDLDSKPARRPDPGDLDPATDRPEDLHRLGLD